jgi:hypothetical protein
LIASKSTSFLMYLARTNLHCGYCGSDKHAVEYCPSTAAGEGNRRRDPNGAFLD